MSVLNKILLLGAVSLLASCGASGSLGSGGSSGLGSGGRSADTAAADRQATAEPERDTIWDLFGEDGDPNREINVNKHLWAASLDILSFLPIAGADPFSGVIVTDWGRINGSSTPYRATVYITEPALDARSLKVAVFRQSGGRAVAVSDDVARQIEDSILTRARQLRIAEAARR